jgi:ADP-ribose pyrophosphatase YjhB (NUDIX family)
MDVRSVGRAAVDRWLKAARFPFDAVSHLLPDDGPGSVSAVLLIDRADASVRAVLGGMFHDDELLDDAARRQVAVEERARAIEIRRAAAQTQQVADAHLADGLDAAARVRASATADARQASKQVEDEQNARKRQVEHDADARERAGEKAKKERLAAAERKAKRDRLKVLDEQAKALDQQADALTATDEAQRLADAAAAVKAARKGPA